MQSRLPAQIFYVEVAVLSNGHQGLHIYLLKVDSHGVHQAHRHILPLPYHGQKNVLRARLFLPEPGRLPVDQQCPGSIELCVQVRRPPETGIRGHGTHSGGSGEGAGGRGTQSPVGQRPAAAAAQAADCYEKS